MIQFLCSLFFVLLLSAKSFAYAPPLVLKGHQEFYELGLHLDLLEDPTGKLTIDDVNRPEWAKKFKRSQDKVPNFGISPSAFWARIRIQNKTKRGAWVLSHKFYLQDDIQFFRLKKGEWTISKTGDFYPFSSRELDSRSFSFSLGPKEDALYFMRIQGASSQYIVTLSTLKRFYSEETNENFMFGIFFGLVVTMIAYNFFIFLATRGKSYFLYVSFISFLGLFLGAIQGFTQKFIFPNLPWFSNNGFFFIAGGSLFFLVLFTNSFLKLKDNTPKAFKVMRIFGLLAFLVMLSSLFLPLLFNVYFTIASALLIFPAVITVGILRSSMNYTPARFFLLAFGAQVLGIGVSIFVLIGVFPSHFLLVQAPIVACSFQFIILSIGLAHKFNLMKEDALKKAAMAKELQESYARNLEREVNLKTKKIKNLVENLGQGFMVIDKEGEVQEGATQITKTFFRTDCENKDLSDILKLSDEKREGFKKWIQNVWRGIIPFKDLIAFAPKVYEEEGCYIELDYRPIYIEGQKGKIDKIICIASDKTHEIVLERELDEDKQRTIFITTCLQNPVEFMDILNDTFLLFETYQDILAMGTDELFRKFHTLKARYGQFGVKHLIEAINDIETCLSRKESDPLETRVQYFEKELKAFIEEHHLVIEASRKFLVDTGNAVPISELMEKSEGLPDKEALLSYFREHYLLSDLKIKFERYRTLVDELADRQGKDIAFYLRGDEIRVDTNQYSHLTNTMIHLFRNMVDHGIEPEDERREMGKAQKGVIKVDFKKEGDHFFIDFFDDGAGIDPEKVKKKVIDLGLKEEKDLKDQDLISMIFLPGFSTKDEVTDISGRGVGMDAVREEVERLGGTIKVDSTLNQGTHFQIELPFIKS